MNTSFGFFNSGKPNFQYFSKSQILNFNFSKFKTTKMTIAEYVNKINAKFRSGLSTEHSYRGDLQNLLEDIATGVIVTNEPTRIECGAPDYIVTKKGIPIGYIEAKDIGSRFKQQITKGAVRPLQSSFRKLDHY